MNNSQNELITTIGEAINLAMADAMLEDENIIIFGEDVADPEGGGAAQITKGLSSRFGDLRVRSTPISEQAILGAAIGASLAGKRPIAEIMMMNFITAAMDMLVNHAAKLRFMSGGRLQVPITVRTMTGTGYGIGGHHGDYFEAWFAHVPGLKVVAPSCPEDAYGLLRSCIADNDPCIFIENVYAYGEKGALPNRGTYIPLGKAKIVKEGSDVTIIGYSRLMKDIQLASDKLADRGISAELIDLRTISPLDVDTLCQSVAKTKKAVVVHESNKQCGVGAEIVARLQEKLFGTISAPIERVTTAPCSIPFSTPLVDEFLPNPSKIEEAALKLCR